MSTGEASRPTPRELQEKAARVRDIVALLSDKQAIANLTSYAVELEAQAVTLQAQQEPKLRANQKS